MPIWRAATYENDSVNTPEERLKEFYQDDHVRLYGRLSFASTNEVFVFQK